MRLFASISLVSALVFAVALDSRAADCAPPPEHRPLAERHGQNHWSDAQIQVFTHDSKPVRIPQGWQPVGAARFDAACATFPPHQAGVFINPVFWRMDVLPVPEAGIAFRRIALKSLPEADVRRLDDKMVGAITRLSRLFPLGLPEDQRAPHDILVTIGVAGDTQTKGTRLYAMPGANLTNWFYGVDEGRGMDLFLHAIAHLYNKQRPRPEVGPTEDGLHKWDFLEYVASWSELAYGQDPDYLKGRLGFIMYQHDVLTDGDVTTWPTYFPLKAISQAQGPYGVPPHTDTKNEAAIEYAHYYLAPLILLGVEALLALDAPDMTVETMLMEIHAGQSPGLLSSLKKYLPSRYGEIDAWMRGTAHIPADLIYAGMDRLKAP